MRKETFQKTIMMKVKEIFNNVLTVRGNRVDFCWKSMENHLIIASSLLIDPAQIYVKGSSKLKMFIVRPIHKYQWNMCSASNVIDT